MGGLLICCSGNHVDWSNNGMWSRCAVKFDAGTDRIQVSAGIDTIPGNVIMCIAYLSSPHGQEIQDQAFSEIMKVYPEGDAWERCLVEEKVPYVTALVKEVLRFWSVIPICLPRTSIKDIEWQGAVIPSGTTFYMNAWAANYDSKHFKDPSKFMPERYLDSLGGSAGTDHYGYGAGSRMCAGSQLANRELYTAFLRLMIAFKFVECRSPSQRPILDALKCNSNPTSLTTDPKPFKCGFKARDPESLKRWISDSEERTKEY